MRCVVPPDLDAGETFATCISRVKDQVLKSRLYAIQPQIESCAANYVCKAQSKELHQMPTTRDIGDVPGEELVKTYTNRMAKKDQPGRPVYEQLKLLPAHGICPFCGHRNVSTLDHILPKGPYTVFAVTPANLVGCCADCNKLKLDVVPTGASDTILHPYFDDIENRQWLVADVVETSPAALTFSVNEVSEWDNDLNLRISNQFNLLGLAQLYSSQAAQETTNIRNNLQRHFDAGGPSLVREELMSQLISRRAVHINSWQTVTYSALTDSDWYCDGGFSKK